MTTENEVSDFLSAYEPEEITAARQIFNTYGGKRMGLAERVEAFVEYVRATPASQLSSSQAVEVLSILDTACDNLAIGYALADSDKVSV